MRPELRGAGAARDEAAMTGAVRRALADETARVQVLEGGQLPGLTVFAAQLRPDLGGHVTGIVTAPGEVFLKLDDVAPRVLAALGADADPVVVAGLIGRLESGGDPTWPILTEAHRDGILRDAWRARVGLPTLTLLPGGGRRYVYWVRSNQPPLWRTQLTVIADGAVTLARTSIGNLPEEGTTP